jgi:rhomboid protease GluP
MLNATCPHCGATLSAVHARHCPECRHELDDSVIELRDATLDAKPRLVEIVTPGTPSSMDAQVDAFRQFHGDLRRQTRRAPVTVILVAANVLVFVVMVLNGVSPINPSAQTLLAWGANLGPQTLDGEWWRMVTATFLHIGFIHLALNMLCLVGVGLVVERLVGSFGFLLLYLCCGVVGSLASIAWSPGMVGAGASGAVFGVFGAFFGATFRARETIPKLALKATRKNTGKLIAINLLAGVALPGIDMAAHVGGLVWGVVCGLIQGHPIRVESARLRPARNALVVVASAVVFAVGLVVAQARVSRSDDPVNTLSRLGTTEEKVLQTYNDSVGRVENGTLTQQQFIGILDKDVLHRWREMRQGVERLLGNRSLDDRFVKQYLEYIVLREQAWELLLKSLQNDDAEALKQAMEKLAQSDRKAEALRRPTAH